MLISGASKQISSGILISFFEYFTTDVLKENSQFIGFKGSMAP